MTTNARMDKLNADLAAHRAETKAAFAELRADMKADRAETRTAFAELRADMNARLAEHRIEMNADRAVIGNYTRILVFSGTALVALMLVGLIFATR